jgi:hypothetical protein
LTFCICSLSSILWRWHLWYFNTLPTYMYHCWHCRWCHYLSSSFKALILRLHLPQLCSSSWEHSLEILLHNFSFVFQCYVHFFFGPLDFGLWFMWICPFGKQINI